MTVVPAGTFTSPTVVDVRAIRKWALTGLSIRDVSSRNPGILLRSSRKAASNSGFSPMIRTAELTSFVVVSVPAAKRNVDRFHDVFDVG